MTETARCPQSPGMQRAVSVMMRTQKQSYDGTVSKICGNTLSFFECFSHTHPRWTQVAQWLADSWCACSSDVTQLTWKKVNSGGIMGCWQITATVVNFWGVTAPPTLLTNLHSTESLLTQPHYCTCCPFISRTLRSAPCNFSTQTGSNGSSYVSCVNAAEEAWVFWQHALWDNRFDFSMLFLLSQLRL